MTTRKPAPPNADTIAGSNKYREECFKALCAMFEEMTGMGPDLIDPTVMQTFFAGIACGYAERMRDAHEITALKSRQMFTEYLKMMKEDT